MKINFFTLIICLFYNLSFSQETNPLEITIPSPQAFELTKYGNVPVDESSGRVSPSIPIHTYKAGNLELNMSLMYSGNGVKVEQKPTWTGINWLLNAGGVITRVVKDLPDETNKPRVFYTESELDNMAIYTNQTGAHITINDLDSDVKSNLVNNYVGNLNSYDTEVDIFNYSFNGHNGSFYLKEISEGVFEARLLKYDEELKIELLGNFTEYGTYSFKITTPNGNIYHFGGDTLTNPGNIETVNTIATEESQTIERGASFLNQGVRAKTAYYLTKIENNFGDKIYLEYTTDPTSEAFLAKSYSRGLKIFENPDALQDDPEINCFGGLPEFDESVLAVKFYKNITYNAKHLKRIWSPQNPNNVIFDTFEVTNYINHQAFGIKFRVLSGINFGTKTIDFEYIPNKAAINIDLQREKFFLNEVIFKNADGSLIAEEYSMEYNEPLSIPQNSISNAQDFLGYYNGKTNNPSLLPKNSLKYLQYYLDKVPASYSNYNMNFVDFNHIATELGDRDPNFSNAIKGSLTKLKYPTGGYTTFEYEPVTKEIKYLTTSAYLKIYNDTGTSTPRIPDVSLMDGEGIGYYDQLFNSTSAVFPVYITQDISVSLSVLLGTDMFAFSNKDYIYVKMRNIDTNEEIIKKWFFPSPGGGDYITSFNPSLDFQLIKDNKYTFTLGMGRMPGDVLYNNSNMTGLLNTIPFEINASINYIYDIDNSYINGSGIRIKRVKDFNGNDTTPSISKRFYYSSLKKIMNNDTPETDKVITFHPLFHSFFRDARLCEFIDEVSGSSAGHSLPFYQVRIFAFLNSNSFTLNLPSSDVYAMYPVVTTSLGGDNFEGGAIEKKFRIIEDLPPNLFNSCIVDCDFVNSFMNFDQNTSTNYSNYNGTLLKETFWDKSTTLKKIKETNFSYEFDIYATQSNLSGRTNGSDGYYGNKDCIGLYNVLSHKTNKITATTKEYIDGVPITNYLPPFELYDGWQHDDHDGDEIRNIDDDDFITPEVFYTISEEELEVPFKKIITTQEITFVNNLAGLPKQIITGDSNSGENKIINYYPIPEDISVLSSLTSDEVSFYNILKQQNRIDKPIQTTIFNNNELVSTTRTTYSNFGGATPVSIYKFKVSKGASSFSDKIIFNKYDENGNPLEIQYNENGIKVVYIWDYRKLPIYKVINSNYASVVDAISSFPIISSSILDDFLPVDPTILNPFITLLPNSEATIYNYDPLTGMLLNSFDSKGDRRAYFYDTFNRLQYVKDKDGNILRENETHFKN